MQHTFQINTAQLNSNFIESVKAIFKNRDIKIVVEEVAAADKKINTSEAKRFLDHRTKHPATKISSKEDFNDITGDLNL